MHKSILNQPMTAGGIVLCGGRSTRMGRPKAWLSVGGESLLARTVRILGHLVSPVVVVAAEGQDLPALPDSIRVARDARPDRGPLEGLAAGLDALATDTAYLTACDAPLLQPAFVRFIVGALGDYDAAVPHVDGRPHPLASAVRVVAARRAIRDQLNSNSFALRAAFDRMNVRWLDERILRDIEPLLESLGNVNTPEQFADVERLISSMSASRLEGP